MYGKTDIKSCETGRGPRQAFAKIVNSTNIAMGMDCTYEMKKPTNWHSVIYIESLVDLNKQKGAETICRSRHNKHDAPQPHRRDVARRVSIVCKMYVKRRGKPRSYRL